MKRPGYSLSRRAFWISFWFAWGGFWLLLIAGLFGSETIRTQALELSKVWAVFTSAVILGTLGIHRGFGSMDYRSQLDARPAVESEGEE